MRGVIARFDLVWIDIQRIGPNIDEHRNGSAQHHRICRRRKCIGRHDDFIPRTEVRQDGGHFKRSRARMRQQGVTRAHALLEPGLAAAGVVIVSFQFPPSDRVRKIRNLVAGDGRQIEWNSSNLRSCFVSTPGHILR